MILEHGECNLDQIVRKLLKKGSFTPAKLRYFWEEMLEVSSLFIVREHSFLKLYGHFLHFTKELNFLRGFTIRPWKPSCSCRHQAVKLCSNWWIFKIDRLWLSCRFKRRKGMDKEKLCGRYQGLFKSRNLVKFPNWRRIVDGLHKFTRSAGIFLNYQKRSFQGFMYFYGFFKYNC